MNAVIKDGLERMINEAVEAGRFSSPQDMVTEALGLLKMRGQRRAELSRMPDEAIAAGGTVDDEGLDAAPDQAAARLLSHGFGP